jgi:hypothetical protein
VPGLPRLPRRPLKAWPLIEQCERLRKRAPTELMHSLSCLLACYPSSMHSPLRPLRVKLAPFLRPPRVAPLNVGAPPRGSLPVRWRLAVSLVTARSSCDPFAS